MARNPAALTAFGPMALTAIEQHEPPGRRLVDDDLAASFLPQALRALVAATRWAPLRRTMVAASDRSAPGMWANMACRKRYADDNLMAALAGIDAVVVLGAGLDTRGCRLSRHSVIPVFEVDQTVNIERKRAILRRVFGTPPPSVHLVAVDFERDDLMSALAGQGYQRDARTFFIWEGVTQYLTAAAIDSTFEQLRSVPTGSRLDFTYVQRDFIDGVDISAAPSLYHRFRERSQVWKFGLRPDEVAQFLDGYGWQLLDQLGPDEVRDRYVRPTGRALPTSGLEWSALAGKP
ncbi:SAM-dependent methyltransferase [Mycolicibacterium aubagnense]|uniref:S-adenosyl-L-methionine-dependent methyltransferase n=1 Tax=Mycolicibacterium aubagnense TaxID=319707 RepID=A0ABN5Z0R8_9MYCO|nr:SAM-dependent methyltransferase [Mycolicibacterium aubagnense]TLH64920.1 SAM-dependent methyltransferase [Mycolicibacterium aubagnense]WGI30892.1 SAM-dependent methyltransferase [Mycolicibacterium aubagnense]BBX87752.1 S-adenosyl-L-methionine-dependent methyltransferase [Mycolicibacterium aubagnense]